MLSPLKRLSGINVQGNKISDISVLGYFDKLTYLWLGNNEISDISVLSRTTSLKSIWLQRNCIIDITPLVENKTITKGVTVNLRGNPLCEESVKTHITELKDRGVEVYYKPLSIH